MARSRSARTAGSSGPAAERPTCRSMPRAWCARSLVPTAKKSACTAKRSASSAADGTSTIIPTGTGASLALSSSSVALHSSTSARAAWNSASVATIGNISATGPSSLARNTALIWVFSHAPSRPPRSSARRRLSPRQSKVRKTTRFGAIALMTPRYSWSCSSSDGGSRRSRHMNSVRIEAYAVGRVLQSSLDLSRQLDVGRDRNGDAIAGDRARRALGLEEGGEPISPPLCGSSFLGRSAQCDLA